MMHKSTILQKLVNLFNNKIVLLCTANGFLFKELLAMLSQSTFQPL